MNILVLDTAASTSGAETVLTQYYEKVKSDKSNKYYFCVSIIPLYASPNITILSFPWTKLSWVHRLFFDYIYSKVIIHRYKIDHVISLQNMGLPFCNLPQTIFLQNALPFSKHRFSFFKEPILWLYQNVIGKLICRSLNEATCIIVQTNWMKNAIVSSLGISSSKIIVEKPLLKLSPTRIFDSSSFKNTFFYPATRYCYKNHIVIYKAVQILKNQGITNFKIILTLTYSSLPHDCKEIHNQLRNYFQLAGILPHEKVFDLYSHAILIFPSYLETVGLPLIEAKLCNSPIIVANEPFAREILSDYCCVDFFEHNDANTLAEYIKKHMVATQNFS